MATIEAVTPESHPETVIPTPALVVLVGASGAGKTTWAEANFKPGQVLSTDTFRAYYGAGPDDRTAGTEAFALLDHLIAVRLAKGLTTVVDTTGLDADRRGSYRAAAAEAGLPCVAVGFDTDPELCRDRNRSSSTPIPKTVLDRQLRQWRATRGGLDQEGYDLVIVDPGPSRNIPRSMVPTTGASAPPSEAADAHDLPSVRSSPRISRAETHTSAVTGGPRPDRRLTFDLAIGSYEFGDADIGTTVVDIARAAERVGFRALWVMDHFRQVPQIGRAWEPMLEAYTTLAYLAGQTERLRLGTLVTGIEHRNVGLLAKIVATLDVLSGGRAECGLGAGWFSAEQAAYGYPVNSNRVRLDTLEEALQALPILWGPGAKAFDGRVVSIPEAMAYPRPVQDPVPILVGGGGERRTLRLAARYGHACNVLGRDPAVVAHKIDVVRQHCIDVDRNPDDLVVTTLNPLIHATSGRDLDDLIESLRPPTRAAELYATANQAATTDEHVARFRRLSNLGVERVCVSLVGNTGPDRVASFAAVIDAFA
jgi:F420-dependent oxidoreductase-like protein